VSCHEAAAAALLAELGLADGNLDAVDRKSALLPAFLAALAGLFIGSDSGLGSCGLVSSVQGTLAQPRDAPCGADYPVSITRSRGWRNRSMTNKTASGVQKQPRATRSSSAGKGRCQPDLA